jgi:hypothetical protein
MRNLSLQFATLCLLALPAIVGCTADLDKLRAPSRKDSGLSDVAADSSDLPFSLVETTRDSDAPAGETATVGSDGAGGASGASGSLGGASGASGGAAGDGGGGEAGAGGDGAGGSGGASSTNGSGGSGFDIPSLVVDSGSSEGIQADLGSTEDVVTDVPADLSSESTGDAFFDAALDVPADTWPDIPAGTLTCPATISGSLDSSDQVQSGRLSRIAPVSTCGIGKQYPTKDADPTNPHLYDVYHFINPTGSPVCFNFALTYRGPQLYAAAYAAFDRTDIGKGYLGDVGDSLTSPQEMGITVGAASTVDVVISAVAIGTDPAGPYTLSCSAQ